VSAPLSAAFECITDAFFALDRRWRFTYINHEAERFLMRSRADLLGVELWTAFPELIGTRFERSYRQAMAEQTPVEFESPVRPLDRWFEVRAYPSLDGLSIYFLDITQRKQAEQALRHQNAYLAALHETTLALMNRLDLSDVLETIVVRAAALIGTEHGYIYLVDDDAETITIRVGTGIFNDFVGEQLRRGQALAGRVWQTGQPLSVPDYSRWPERAPDYERSDLRACAAVPLTSDGAVVGVLGLGYAASSRVFGDDQFMVLVRFAQLASIALDNARLYTAAQRELADRKRAEAALRANEQRYRALFEHTNDAVFMISLDGVIAAGNQQACDLLGYSHAELVGMSLAQITLPEDRHAGQERLIALITGQPLATYERTMLTKSGATIWVEVSAALVRDGAGQPLHLQSIVRDITERKRSQDALRESEARYRLLFSSNPHPMWVLDQETLAFLAVNEAAIRHYGYARDEFLAMTIRDLRVPEDLSQLVAHLAEYGPDADPPSRWRHRKKDGAVIDVEISSQAIEFAGRRAKLILSHDITQRLQAEAALQHERDLLQTMMDSVPDGIYFKDVAGRFIRINRAQAQQLGLCCPEDAIGKTNFDILDADHAHAIQADERQIIATGVPLLDRLEQFVDDDGQPIWNAVTKVPIRDLDGQIVGTVGIARDITERVKAEAAMRISEAQFRAIFENAALGITLGDLSGAIIETNGALQRMLGYTADELRGKTFAMVTHPDDLESNINLLQEVHDGLRTQYQMEKRYLRKDGEVIWGHLSVSLVPHTDAGQALMIGMVEDITERKRSEETIRQMAYYDALTGLPNRLLFHDRLRQAIVRARRSQHCVALLFLDLDRFKIINDTLGHYTGDLLLEAVARRLTDCVRDGDTVARMGGDEFTITLPGIVGASDAIEVAQRILTQLTSAFTLGGQDLFVTVSIGISLFPDDGEDADTLLKHADTAMYRAKERSRNSYQFYDPAMNLLAFKQLELEQHLRRALERGEFQVFYQPRVHAMTGQINGLEALVRWNHPERGLITPGEFIPVAEDTGLIVPLGEWVLRMACAQNKAWQTAGLPTLRMAVNLSPRQFQQPDLAERVAQVLAETGLEPQYLELEITESMTMVHAERTMLLLRTLKHMGVHLSMDDFGTGYSSLGYLKQFPIDTLKIDKSFVRDLTTDPNDAAIAEAVIALAHSLNLSVTAEGVETEAQLSFLKARRCDEVQGYLIGRPAPGETIEQLLVMNSGMHTLGAVQTSVTSE
jgi:diguanylate cyclase (GGDEF)-like protein/PAS domain S-box-containing protein